ncbi:ABC-type multidrug transport system fused ATPase/permease subunit [Microbacterium testaceum]|uniref:ABC transporter ATP-binding protein n=1 Tax=Microbacterium testaceum TaxID=2033 RepID=UPI00278B8350|nr:ABC transporter ATP-binding protein [Microbacterium testaceum]MDQ1110788.1 ABC-type multidrug transport system fused ATPase/permease subunit [Microbacterium testaceum]
MSVPLPLAPAGAVAREMWRAFPRGWWRLPALFVVVLAAAAAGVVGPLALGAVVDAIGAGGDDPGLAWTLAAVMAGAVVLASVLTAVGTVSASRLFEHALASLRERMVDTALHLPPARIERAGTGDLVARAGDDVAEVSGAIPQVVPALVGSAFTIVVTLVGMAVIDPWYAVALVVVTPLHVFAVRRYLRAAPAVYAAERAAMSDRAQHLLDALRGLETVRAYRTESAHLSRISTASWAVVRWSMRARHPEPVLRSSERGRVPRHGRAARRRLRPGGERGGNDRRHDRGHAAFPAPVRADQPAPCSSSMTCSRPSPRFRASSA